MEVSKFNRFRFPNKFNRKFLIDKELYLYKTTLTENEKYPGTKYYHCLCYLPEQDNWGYVDLFGKLILQKLSILEGLVVPDPVHVRLSQWFNKDLRPFNDITYLNFEMIEENYELHIPDGWLNDVRQALDNLEEYKQAELDFGINLIPPLKIWSNYNDEL